jgi:processive 1,2-diacylglycerol beta-glucosyltransferase
VIEVRDKSTHVLLGTIPDEDLQALMDHLEETNLGDQDYYIDEATIEMLAEAGASASLTDFLRRALGGREGVDIEWSRR